MPEGEAVQAEYQSRVGQWRRFCCQAMLAGLLMSALGMGLLERFPSTQSAPGATVQSKAQHQAERLNADALSWAPPIALFSGMVLLGSECRETGDERAAPRTHFAAADSDRAPPNPPRCGSALKHT